jgi:surfactin family lipopeptide synthetase A
MSHPRPRRFVPPPLVVRAPEAVVPLSFAQQRLWFIEQLEPGSTAYNVSVLFRLRGRIDRAALHDALAGVVRRHAALRCHFTDALGEARQIIDDDFALAMPIEAVTAADVPAAARREARRAFDLATGPLFRVRLLAIESGDHALIVVAHHSVCDQWSVGILVSEAAKIYRGARPPALAVQYPDFAVWQRGWMTADALAPQLAYWRQQLADIPDGLDLPSDRPRPATRSGRGARLFPRLPRPLVRALTEFSRRERVTLYMTLLAGFDCLLWRYTGQADVVVGTPIAGRNRKELEGLVGFFANTLVIRVGVDSALGFRDLVQRVRAVCLDAFAHQDVPFEQLVDAVKPTRDLSRTPIFEVMFGLQTPFPHVELGESTLTPELLDAGTATFDLTVSWEERDGELWGWVEYNTDLFDAPTIERMIDHYRVLLEAAVARPDDRLAALPLLGDAERDRIVHAWNRTQAPPPRHAHVGELFDAQARRTPDAIAVIDGDDHVTYRDLDQRAERWAAVLRARGCGPGSRVALALSRGVAFPTLVLAVLKAGAAYVPLDPAYPADRLAFMIRDCAARVLISEAALAQGLPAGNTEVLLVDAPPPAVAKVSERRTASADDLAYVIYTSGSTGRPKGVAMPHRAVVNLITWQAQRSPEPMRTLQFASPSFDVSFQELFATWANGGTIVLASEDERRDPDALLRRLAAARVERLFLPFVALHQLAEAAHERPVAGLALREVITAGEQLRITPAIAAMFTTLPACRLYNQYGPTETHLASELALTGAPPLWDALPSIGRPIANVRIYVLDGDRQPVPIGVPGELYIAGAGVARGYLGRDELTRERFVADPFVGGDERMYKTGDRAKYLPSGELVFLGRADDQIKLRGYRIELGEIEAALSSHADLREAAVIVRRDHAGGAPRLVGYVTCYEPAPTIAAIKNHLRARLPDYMVPAAIMILPALPLSPNRKIDRKALPKPDDDAAVYVAPRTALEAQVAAVWAAVLGVERVGVTESFFEAGGHSLLATQVVSRLRAQLAIELPVRALFEAPTIEALAARIATAAPTEDSTIPIVDRVGALPLSFAQQRMWYLAQLEPGGFTYNVPWFVRLTGALDLAALEAALRRVIDRHEVLRTRFVEIDGEPRAQLAAFDVAIAVETVDEAALAARAVHEARQPFDLATGPLIRARVLRVAADHVLLFTMHHIVCDGWSIAIVLRELGAAYRAIALPPLALQYADFAAWQRARLTGPRLADDLAYWQAQLAGAPPVLELPTDRPRPAIRGVRGAAVDHAIPAPIARATRAFAQREAVSEFMTLLAAYAVLLARHSGQADVVIGSPIAGRDRGEVEPLIGLFVNTLALRVDTAGATSFRALVGRVRETCLAAYAHQELPFDRVVDAIKPDRDPRTTPIFQVMFAIKTALTSDLGVPGLTARPLDVHPGMAKFELTLFAHLTDDGLATTWEYNTDLFDRPTIERMAARFAILLGELVAAPDRALDAAPMISPTEHAALRAIGEARSELPADASLHALFEAQVVRAPDAPAITFGAAHLTYAELNTRANQLAHHLIALGVPTGDRVGVCLGRSIDFVVAVIAAIKAGAAYVPLDPAYPTDRLAYMTDDVRARVVISRAWLAAAAPALADRSTTNPPIVATSRDLAYVMYTSGSTGRPKGTCIEQRAIARLVLATDYVQLTARDVVGYASNTSFDAATFEIWGALLTGARLHGIAPDVVLSPELFTRELAASGITALFITTALFHQLAAVAPDAFRTVDHLLFGGEVCDVAAVRRVLAVGPRRLLHVYGPTETTTFATWHHVRAVEPGATSIPIGRPLANTTIRILDRARQPVPIGVRGEIFIGGPGVARGYWNRPELTAERFVDDPLAPGERLYKTGDLAAWRADGAIEFHGRADHQVKLRGFRIELGELEAELLAHPDITAAIAIVRTDTGDPRLVAYVAPRAGAALDVDDVRDRLAAVLPRYMLPSAIVVLDVMPVTPNGKIDRAALPAPSARRDERGSGYVAPDGELAQAIARIWAEVLGVDRVGADDNFFALGGSSLLLVAVRSRLEAVLGRPVALKPLAEAASVRELAARIADDTAASCLIRLQAGPRPPVYFIHGGGGSALAYRDLARAIDGERAMIGFAARGLDSDEPPHASIEAMASHYLALARTVHPGGPYLLVGASFGGTVAYEMARQLTAAGDSVALCALLDAPGPGSLPVVDLDPADLLAFHLEARRWLDPSALRGRALDEQLQITLDTARVAGVALPFTSVAHGRRHVAVWENHIRALRAYAAPAWPGGAIDFFSPADALPGSPPSHLARAWHGRATLHVEVAGGDHLSMIAPPHAATLGARLRSLIATRTRSSAP